MATKPVVRPIRQRRRATACAGFVIDNIPPLSGEMVRPNFSQFSHRHRSAAALSDSRASIHVSPEARSSAFQIGASVLR